MQPQPGPFGMPGMRPGMMMPNGMPYPGMPGPFMPGAGPPGMMPQPGKPLTAFRLPQSSSFHYQSAPPARPLSRSLLCAGMLRPPPQMMRPPPQQMVRPMAPTLPKPAGEPVPSVCRRHLCFT